MASLQELKTIDLIRRGRKKAKKDGVRTADFLSKGVEGYRNSLCIMERVGAWAVGVSLFTFILYVTVAIIGITTEIDLGIIASPIVTVITAIYAIMSLILGVGLYLHDFTPRATRIALVIILIMNILFVEGIFPLLVVIFSIIALTRCNTYADWFNRLGATSRATKKKSVSSKREPSSIKPRQKSKATLLLTIFLIVSVVAAIGGSVGFYFLGRHHGWDDGSWQGYLAGYDRGYDSGVTDGRSTGYNAGYNTGYSRGYDEGFEEMRVKAMCIVSGRYGC